MDHVRLDATRLKPARQPEAVAAGFEGQRNPGDRAAGSDHLIPPAMQQSKQPFWARLQLFAWLTLNTGKHAGNQPARVAQLDHGNDRAILVQGDEGSAQVVWLGHRGTPSIKCSDEVAMPRRPPHSVYRSPVTCELCWRGPPLVPARERFNLASSALRTTPSSRAGARFEQVVPCAARRLPPAG